MIKHVWKFWKAPDVGPVEPEKEIEQSQEEQTLIRARKIHDNCEKEFKYARDLFMIATSDLAKANSEYLLSIERKIPNDKRSHKNL